MGVISFAAVVSVVPVAVAVGVSRPTNRHIGCALHLFEGLQEKRNTLHTTICGALEAKDHGIENVFCPWWKNPIPCNIF